MLRVEPDPDCRMRPIKVTDSGFHTSHPSRRGDDTCPKQVDSELADNRDDSETDADNSKTKEAIISPSRPGGFTLLPSNCCPFCVNPSRTHSRLPSRWGTGSLGSAVKQTALWWPDRSLGNTADRYISMCQDSLEMRRTHLHAARHASESKHGEQSAG
jgi:hypothetical protein